MKWSIKKGVVNVSDIGEYKNELFEIVRADGDKSLLRTSDAGKAKRHNMELSGQWEWDKWVNKSEVRIVTTYEEYTSVLFSTDISIVENVKILQGYVEIPAKLRTLFVEEGYELTEKATIGFNTAGVWLIDDEISYCLRAKGTILIVKRYGPQL